MSNEMDRVARERAAASAGTSANAAWASRAQTIRRIDELASEARSLIPQVLKVEALLDYSRTEQVRVSVVSKRLFGSPKESREDRGAVLVYRYRTREEEDRRYSSTPPTLATWLLSDGCLASGDKDLRLTVSSVDELASTVQRYETELGQLQRANVPMAGRLDGLEELVQGLRRLSSH
jgi:hypothetical protein